MEKWKKRSIELLAALAFGGENGLSVVPYYPQKTMVGCEEEGYFRRSIPEKHGVSSLRIYNMLCELESEKRANVHSIMVLKNGEVICECSAKAYSQQAELIKQQIEMIQASIAEVDALSNTLDDIEGKESIEAFVPVGAGSFIKGELKSTDEIMRLWQEVCMMGEF